MNELLPQYIIVLAAITLAVSLLTAEATYFYQVVAESANVSAEAQNEIINASANLINTLGVFLTAWLFYHGVDQLQYRFEDGLGEHSGRITGRTAACAGTELGPSKVCERATNTPEWSNV